MGGSQSSQAQSPSSCSLTSTDSLSSLSCRNDSKILDEPKQSDQLEIEKRHSTPEETHPSQLRLNQSLLQQQNEEDNHTLSSHSFDSNFISHQISPIHSSSPSGSPVRERRGHHRLFFDYPTSSCPSISLFAQNKELSDLSSLSEYDADTESQLASPRGAHRRINSESHKEEKMRRARVTSNSFSSAKKTAIEPELVEERENGHAPDMIVTHSTTATQPTSHLILSHLRLSEESDVHDESSDLAFSTFMPITTESMHALEHSLLRVIDATRPETLVYKCPLCDDRFERPQRWKPLYEHYVQCHWKTRQYLGHYVIFPCRRIHQRCLTNVILNLHQQKMSNHKDVKPKHPRDSQFVPQTEISNDRILSKHKRHFNQLLSQHPNDTELQTIASMGLYNMPEHFHCPSWKCTTAFPTFEELQDHCSQAHANTTLDPMMTPANPEILYTPLLDPVSIDILPLRQEETNRLLEDMTALPSSSFPSSDSISDELPRYRDIDNSPTSSSNAELSPSTDSSLRFSLYSSPQSTSSLSTGRRRVKLTRSRFSVPVTAIECHNATSLSPSPACRAFHLLIGSPPLKKKDLGEEAQEKRKRTLSALRGLPINSRRRQDENLDRRHAKRVRFSDQVYQVTFDKTRSKVEKYGSVLGPNIGDIEDTTDPIDLELNNVEEEEDVTVILDSPADRSRRSSSRFQRQLIPNFPENLADTPYSSGEYEAPPQKKRKISNRIPAAINAVVENEPTSPPGALATWWKRLRRSSTEFDFEKPSNGHIQQDANRLKMKNSRRQKRKST